MRLDLKVPFAEKDQAKKLGARWDPGRKLWYIEGHLDAALFARWQPTPHDASVTESSPPRRSRPAQPASAGKTQVGSRFVKLPRGCDCLPWDDCDKCRHQAWPD
ncbi:MAG TPA: DUF5710 domain-containing protein [Rhodocyclaceae bacterium]|nr:DUF5710 domain-containing protein [Rhodocyclaceae bacterium]